MNESQVSDLQRFISRLLGILPQVFSNVIYPPITLSMPWATGYATGELLGGEAWRKRSWKERGIYSGLIGLFITLVVASVIVLISLQFEILSGNELVLTIVLVTMIGAIEGIYVVRRGGKEMKMEKVALGLGKPPRRQKL